MSYPHFYMGSEFYRNQSEGLNPQKEKHQTIVEIEPVRYLKHSVVFQLKSVDIIIIETKVLIIELCFQTAVIPMQVKIRVQMNIEIKKTKYFPPLKNIPDMVHPIFWMDQVRLEVALIKTSHNISSRVAHSNETFAIRVLVLTLVPLK
jgi:hypothetical protein